jgi:hypothetical protein
MNERREAVHLGGICVDQIACLAHDTAQRTTTCFGKQLMPGHVAAGRPADSPGALLHKVHVALRVHRYRLCTQSQIPRGVDRSEDEAWTSQALVSSALACRAPGRSSLPASSSTASTSDRFGCRQISASAEHGQFCSKGNRDSSGQPLTLMGTISTCVTTFPPTGMLPCSRRPSTTATPARANPRKSSPTRMRRARERGSQPRMTGERAAVLAVSILRCPRAEAKRIPEKWYFLHLVYAHTNRSTRGRALHL